MAEIPVNLPASINARVAFIGAATWHGGLEQAEAILAAYPEIAEGDIHTAAILGHDEAVRRFLALDTANATATSDPYGGDALVYLCLSKYLRIDESRSAGFLRAATALLEAGANPNSGFWIKGINPEFETALYGAAGVAHHAGLTRLLLEWGADPNDEEAVYHSPETHDNNAMKLLVETGRLTEENLLMMLIRKLDWHDYEGVTYLLKKVNPGKHRTRGWHPIHHSLARSNSLAIITLLLDHGADPLLPENGLTAIARAAREGRSDVLALLGQRGIPLQLQGVDTLIAACARGDAEQIRLIIEKEPRLADEVIAMGGALLARFSGTGNLAGVRQLLDLGIDVTAPFMEGDGYFGIPKGSLAIHIAAWRGHPAIVQLLIDRGSPFDTPDGNGRTPLALAIRACVDSYWAERRTPASVQALLNAGATVGGIHFPTGYDAIDELLKKYFL
jgi:ankyrin repeat protein